MYTGAYFSSRLFWFIDCVVSINSVHLFEHVHLCAWSVCVCVCVCVCAWSVCVCVCCVCVCMLCVCVCVCVCVCEIWKVCCVCVCVWNMESLWSTWSVGGEIMECKMCGACGVILFLTASCSSSNDLLLTSAPGALWKPSAKTPPPPRLTGRPMGRGREVEWGEVDMSWPGVWPRTEEPGWREQTQVEVEKITPSSTCLWGKLPYNTRACTLGKFSYKLTQVKYMFMRETPFKGKTIMSKLENLCHLI